MVGIKTVGKRFIVFANSGELGKKEKAEFTRNLKGKTLIALDGGAQALKKLRIWPAVALGDFDSLSDDEQRALVRHRVNLILNSDQNSTDLEKGIAYCDEQGAKSIEIYNAMGGDRIDHTLAAFHVLKKHHRADRKLSLISGHSRVRYYKNSTANFQVPASVLRQKKSTAAFGIFGFSKAKVTIQGLEYDVENYPLEFGKASSSSNYVRSPHVKIKVSGEALIVQPFL